MLRRFGLLILLAAFIPAGCSIDRVEWETSGFPVEEVRDVLEEEHSAESSAVECIQREVAGMEWVCRARAAEAAFECEVKAWPRKAIRKIECEREHEQEPAEHEGEGPAGEEHAPSSEKPVVEHAPAGDEPAGEEEEPPAEH